VALAAGFGRGVVNTVADAGPVYFDGVAMLVFLLLVGRYLQLRGQRAAADATELLFSITPSTARVVAPDGAVRDTPAEGLVPGDLVDVRAGDTLPADGVVESGSSSINLALLTGESRPVTTRPGDEVFGGTLNVTSSLRVRVTRPGELSRVAKLVRQVEEGARRRAPVVLLADRLAGWFTAAVLVLAVLVYVVWLNIDPAKAMDNAIALLVVTCPCALALATPLAVTAAVGRAARRGILIKGGDALERLAKPTTLILDKTGTITEGAISMVRFEGPTWVRPLVLALEAESAHPLAAAFLKGLGPSVLPDVESSRHMIGSGIVGRVGGHDVVVGKQSFVLETIEADQAHAAFESRVPDPEVRNVARDSGEHSGLWPPASGHGTALTTAWVAVDGTVVARAWFGDAVRSDASRSIATLRGAGWHIGMASGDDQAVADAVAAQVGIEREHVVGGASPEEKLALVERASGRRPVVMVGDGVNDAAAIAAASVGIGVHGGAEASLAAADVYLTRPGLAPLVELMEGARRTMRLIRTGMLLSLGYNAVGVALAVAGWINPLVAAVMMPASSMTVLLVAWRGRTFVEATA
jgi:Cu2+-exporting ATPase